MEGGRQGGKAFLDDRRRPHSAEGPVCAMILPLASTGVLP